MDELEKLLGEVKISPDIILFGKKEEPQMSEGQIMGLLGQTLNQGATFKLDLDVEELKQFQQMQEAPKKEE